MSRGVTNDVWKDHSPQWSRGVTNPVWGDHSPQWCHVVWLILCENLWGQAGRRKMYEPVSCPIPLQYPPKPKSPWRWKQQFLRNVEINIILHGAIRHKMENQYLSIRVISVLRIKCENKTGFLFYYNFFWFLSSHYQITRGSNIRRIGNLMDTLITHS
jgi:hypothetical protein